MDMIDNSKLRKSRIDLNDIVGQKFGNKIVLEYVGSAYVDGAKQITRYYIVECLICGNRRVVGRHQAKDERIGMCRTCKQQKLMAETDLQAKVTEVYRMRTVARKNNFSTGIKRYQKTKTKFGYQHRVSCKVDKKRYEFINKTVTYEGLVEECVIIANELNQVLSHGKEYFHQWLLERGLNDGN